MFGAAGGWVDLGEGGRWRRGYGWVALLGGWARWVAWRLVAVRWWVGWTGGLVGTLAVGFLGVLLASVPASIPPTLPTSNPPTCHQGDVCEGGTGAVLACVEVDGGCVCIRGEEGV